MIRIEVWRSFYQDSMALMQLAAHLRALPGIREAAALMGTPANHAVLAAAGLATAESAAAAPGDLVLAVDAMDDAAASAAFAAAKALVDARQRARESTGRAQPRTIEAAQRDAPDATLALISVPGAYATLEASTALRRGLHVFLFSDNVAVEDEITLKRLARERRLFCMGPDCGTAYVRGVGLGFANVVPPGRIGCVAASGTGLQAVASRLAALGEGVSHAIGTGGRDLSAAVGGVMTTAALEALAADPATKVIVVISKPPAPEVVPTLIAALRAVGKPIVVCALGASAPPGAPGSWVATLEDAADAATAIVRGESWTPRAFTDADAVQARLETLAHDAERRGPALLALYTGGTLAHEAHLLLEPALGTIGGNVGHGGASGHQIIDLGDDEFTRGRPHPMIDPGVRDERVRSAGAARDVGVLLVDLVLGRAAHADPARSLADAIRDARATAARDGRTLTVVASVVGTDADPQGLKAQIAQLVAAGVDVLPSSAQAARFAAAVLRPASESAVAAPARDARSSTTARTPDASTLLDRPLHAINVGLDVFAQELKGAGVPVVHVDWRPPAGDADVAALLARFEDC